MPMASPKPPNPSIEKPSIEEKPPNIPGMESLPIGGKPPKGNPPNAPWMESLPIGGKPPKGNPPKVPDLKLAFCSSVTNNSGYFLKWRSTYGWSNFACASMYLPMASSLNNPFLNSLYRFLTALRNDGSCNNRCHRAGVGWVLPPSKHHASMLFALQKLQLP